MKTTLTFEQLLEIHTLLNRLDPADKEKVSNYLHHLNSRVMELENLLNNISLNIERITPCTT